MGKIDKIQQQLEGTEYLPLLEYWTFDAEAENKSPRTIEAYWENMSKLFLWCLAHGITNPADIDKTVIRTWIIEATKRVREKTLSAHTINARLRHWRAFYRVLTREGMVAPAKDPMDGIRPVKAPKILKTVITPEQITKIIKHRMLQRKKFYPIRNRIIILLLWDCMIRVGELVGMTDKSVLLHQSLIRVFGKGDKERLVPMGSITRKRLHKYMQVRYKLPGTALICTKSGDPTTPTAIRQLLRRLDPIAGIHLHPHLIRHSAATNYANQPGARIAALQKILGHESLAVTQAYLHLSAEATVEAYADYSPVKSLRIK